VKLLLDEMYPPALADGLQAAGIDTTTVAAIGLAGSSDAEVFAAAASSGHVLLTENVADFAQIAAEQLTAGGHHPGLLIAPSSRLSSRPPGPKPLIAAIQTIADDQFADRVIYLQQPGRA
jgi:hypothetical protein